MLIGWTIQDTATQGPPNVLRFSCRQGAANSFKKGTISRAEGGQLQAPVGRESPVDA
jgi:hypothetical protein